MRSIPDMKNSRMSRVSSMPAGTAPTAVDAATRTASPSLPAGTKNSPGFVQYWPSDKVKEATKPAATSFGRSRAAAGVTTTGFTLPSSP